MERKHLHVSWTTCCLVVCSRTSVLAVWSCVFLGTVTVRIRRVTTTCSPILTGWCTGHCKYACRNMDEKLRIGLRSLQNDVIQSVCTYTYKIHGLIKDACMLLMVCVYCKYLHSGSRNLRIHWDSHSKHWKMNDGMFLHFDRLGYSLQIRYMTKTLMVHGSTISMHSLIFQVVL